MKKMFIAVLAVVACCFARSSTPYTGLLKNLSIGTFGIQDYSYYSYCTKIDAGNLPFNVDFATSFRTSMEQRVSQKYSTTTFRGSYSNDFSDEVTISEFKNKIKNDGYNIVFFSGHGYSEPADFIGSSIVRHNEASMYDGDLKVEDMEFSKETYFAFFDACNFLSFYTDRKGRDIYGYYKKKNNGNITIVKKQEFVSETDVLKNQDGWEDSQEAKPQNLAYSRFKNAFKNGLHAMFGYSSTVPTLTEKDERGREREFRSLYAKFAEKWVDYKGQGLRIWEAYKYAVWEKIYKEKKEGIEPAVIFRSGTAIGNDGKNHQFKGYCEFYESIYQYSMEVNSLSALALGRKKVVYGKPAY